MVDTIPSNATTGASLDLSEPAWGTIETSGDVDWYRTPVLTAGTHYHFNLLSDPIFGHALSDPRFEIFNSDGVRVERDDDNGDGSNSYVDFVPSSTGQYFIAVAGFSSSTGDYLLTGTVDPSASRFTTGYVEVGKSITGYADVSEYDWYQVMLTGGETYTVTGLSQPGVGNATTGSESLDPLNEVHVQLYDYNGNVLYGDAGQGHFTYTAAYSGSYYIEVAPQHDDGDKGYYSVTVSGSLPLNHAPSGSDKIVTTSEDTHYKFSYSDFPISDPDASAYFGAVIIATLPTHGRLVFGGNDVGVGQRIAYYDLQFLVWIPPTNGAGNGLASLTFEVQDNGGNIARGATDESPNTLTFNVTPVNDAPVITSDGGGATAQINMNENGAPVTVVTASDVDSTPSFAIAGTDAGLFAINTATGALLFNASPDFEAPRDAGHDNTYNITVIATDGALTDLQDLSVVVHNVAGNTIAGTRKANTIDGTHAIDGKGATSEEDTIYGKKGDDKLSGLAGNDTLIGGVGKDTLTGGAGFDHLDGGKDADHFVFATKFNSAGVDTIVKFEHGTDKLALENKVFKAIGSSLSSDEFYAKAGATHGHDKSDHLVYNKSTGDLYYDKDGKGGTAAIHFATLANHPGSLDFHDFLIV